MDLPTRLLAATKSLSETSFDAPYKLTGLPALSVESAITFSTLFIIAALIIFSAPFIFVFKHSVGLNSVLQTLWLPHELQYLV